MTLPLIVNVLVPVLLSTVTAFVELEFVVTRPKS